jgi:fructose-bisphosphate aldolase class II
VIVATNHIREPSTCRLPQSVWISPRTSFRSIHDAAPDLRKGLTTPAEAKQFLEEIHVDTLAPAVGNMHGMLKAMVAGNTKKRLDIERIRAIRAEAPIFMTLHGASGTDDDDLREAIAAGITVVHINTEVRLAWRRGTRIGNWLE